MIKHQCCTFDRYTDTHTHTHTQMIQIINTLTHPYAHIIIIIIIIIIIVEHVHYNHLISRDIPKFFNIILPRFPTDSSASVFIYILYIMRLPLCV